MGDKEKDNLEFSEFSEGSSLHGLKYIGNSNAAIRRRCIWAVFLILTATYLIYTLTTNLIRYYQYPYSLSVTHQTKTEMDMPAISFCNVNKIKDTYFDTNPILLNMTLSEPGEFTIHAGKMQEFLEDQTYVQFLSSKTVWDFFNECGHKKTDMIPIMYHSDSFNFDIQWEYMLTKHGMCVTVNPFNYDNGNVSLVSTRPGGDFSLRILLNAEQYHYSFGARTPGAGFQVLIHDPKEVPDVINQGFMIQPGQVYSVAIKREEHVFLDVPYSSACRDVETPSFVDQFGNKTYYSEQACKSKCFSDAIKKMCNCSVIPGLDLPGCNMFQYYTCILEVNGAFWSDKSLEESCECHRPCRRTVYESEVSSQLYPSSLAQHYYKDIVKYYWAQDPLFYRSNILDFRVYFKSFNYDIYEEIASYTMNQFWAEIGGLMGLCLGASLLTLIEIVEFVVNKTWRAVYKKPTVTTTKVVNIREAPPEYSKGDPQY